MKNEIVELLKDPERGIPNDFLTRLLHYVEGLEALNSELLKSVPRQ